MIRPILSSLMLVTLVLGLCDESAAQQDLTSLQPVPGVETVVVWESETDGYHTYRIPSVIKTPAGTLLAFAEGRKNTRSDTGDIDMLVKRSEDGGRTWSDHQVIWDDGDNVCGNPCPVIDQKTGDIVLLMTHNPGDEHEKDISEGRAERGRTPWIMRSTDDGRTWSEPREITDQAKRPGWRWYATGPGVSIQIRQGPHAGRLIVPANHTEPTTPGGETYLHYAHVLYSDDGGMSWRISESIGPGSNESQVAELSDGRLMINSRSADEPKIRRVSFSEDGGVTWTEPRLEPVLIEPRCQASLLRFDRPGAQQEHWLLFSNPGHPSSRRHLLVRASPDDGVSWPLGHIIEPGFAAYSSLVQIDSDTIGCLYEGSRPGRPYQWIAFSRFDWSVLERPAE
ncbi:MAG: sialidase family protein [Phycisphaeraceae bacterium]